jgi:hypothetical protein
MLTKVEVLSPRSGIPTLLLGEFYPNNNPIQIRDISGLEPVKAEITTTSFNQDGVLFQSSRLGMRNLVFKLGLNPNWIDQTMSTLRRMLYTYFLPKAWCKFRFYSDDMPTVEIEGFIETFEPNIFSQDPEIQISVLCPQPDFVGIDRVTYTGVDIPAATLVLDYKGTVETGFEMNFDLIASPGVQNEAFQTSQPGMIWNRFETQLVGASNDFYLRVLTVKSGKKTEYVRRSDGLIINQIHNKITNPTIGSVWPLIKPGENTLQVTRYGSTNTTPRNWTMRFYNRYGGL